MSLLFSLFVIMSASFASGDDGVYNDSHPSLCQRLRKEAQIQCKGDNNCYTAALSRLVDLYNSELQGEDQSQDLYCNY